MTEPSVPTLADVLAVINHNESDRRWLAARAIRILTEVIQRPASALPASDTELEAVLGALTPDSFPSLHDLQQLRSEIRWAVRIARPVIARGVVIPQGAVSGAIPTLADAIAAVRLQDWDETTRATAIGAVKAFAKALNHLPEAIPARLSSLERQIDASVSYAQLKVSRESFPGMRSRLRRAVRLVDRAHRFRPSDFVGEYAELWAQLEAAYGKAGTEKEQGWRLAEILPLLRFAFERREPLAAVDDAFIGMWISERQQDPAIRKPISAAKKAVRAWNSHVGSNRVPAFPRRALALPQVKVRHKNVRFEDMPESFQDSWRRYESEVRTMNDIVDCVVDDELRDDDELEKDRKLESGTLGNHRAALLRAATAVVAAGTPLAAITSLHSLLGPEVAKLALNAVLRDKKARATAEGRPYSKIDRYAASIGHCLAALAERAQLPGPEIQRIRNLVKKIDPKAQPGESQMGDRHWTRLDAFMDDQNLRKWFDFPMVLFNRAEALRASGHITPTCIVDMQIAISALILQSIPIRRENLGGLRVYGNSPHIRMPVRLKGAAALYIPPPEVKNHVAIDADLEDTIAAWIRIWLDHYRPKLVENVGALKENPHLFPGAGMRHKSLTKLNNQFVARMDKDAGLVMNLHMVRHVAALIILSEDVTLMELVSQLLGDDIETVRKCYARFEKRAVHRRWNQMLKERVQAVQAAGARFKRPTRPEEP